MTRRETTEDDWATPVNLGPTLNSSSHDYSPDLSADGLMLHFASDRPAGYGSHDEWVTTRATVSDPWDSPVNLGSTVNGSTYEGCPSISADGLMLFFNSDRPGGHGDWDIWVTTRATISGPWGTPVNLGPTVNSLAREHCTDILAEGLSLFFVSERSGGTGSTDLWLTTRPSISDPWRPPVNLGPTVNSAGRDTGPIFSADGSTLYFSSDRPGGVGSVDLWRVSIIPIVDLNGDGIVDSADMCIIVDNWNTDHSLCDIGPMPWGDGIVDIQDLIVLSIHLFEEVNDPTLIAHWLLDEAQGIIAYDNAAGCDGTLMGAPVWQPDGGQVNGALQLDGVDDYVVTGAAPNPEGAAFSVLAWIKGGAPGQVVLSQMGKANWLGTDSSEGALMTELTVAGRGSSSLGSQAVITDGNWHRIGFVWDGSYRRLYVDGVVVAEDVQDNLDISSNGLYFGTGKAMESGTFWSGLIDDIRIYNRVVSP